MPKDATKNIDRYKIRGGQLNEFDFHRNQEDFAETQKSDPETMIPGTPPEKRGDGDGALPFLGRLQKKVGKAAKGSKATVRGTAKAKSTVRATAKKSTKTTKASKASKATKTTPRGATAKKLAARKAAKK